MPTNAKIQQPIAAIPQPAPSAAPDRMDMSDNKSDANSKALLKVEDIDINDKDNPQLVNEYVNDIYLYMRQLEVGFCSHYHWIFL